MTAKDALDVVLREVVGPRLRQAGFKGSGRSWQRANSVGDVAFANVQASAFSSAEALSCVINIALLPEPWRDWLAVRRGCDQRSVGYSSGIFRHRLHPTGTPPEVDAWWQVTGAGDAAAAAEDILVQLQERGLPLLVDLLDRSRLLEAVRNRQIGVFDGGFPGYDGQVEAALLADQGPSRRLDELLVSIERQAGASRSADSRAFAAWARSRAT